MKYSVVIPLYNKEHYIAGTLHSVLTQTFPDYEVIVVDDGSTDHSLQACKEVRSDKIRVVQQVNQGVSAARNKGIELAAGEYICFLDADDTWHPDYLQNIETIVQKYPQSDILRPTVLSTPMAAARNRADCRRRMAVCLATGKHWARVMTLSGPPPQRCGARHCWRRVSSGWVKKSGKIWIFGRDWREITRVLPMPPVFAWIITVGQKPTPEHG
ncbi:MAG TPA: glycosyltransferase family A protein [Gemmiger qucibialis]|nr:glycosyltransferase family A protein [Gemmiger qucibialis]